MAALIPSASATGSGTMTLAGPSTNSNQTVTIPDATGTMMLNGPAFSAYASSATSLTNNGYTKVAFQTKEFDTASCYDNSTNYRFTPTVAGYYQVNAGVAASFTTGESTIYIYKNGTRVKNGQDNGALTYQVNIASLIYLNGSTDYIEIYVYQGTGAAINTSATLQSCWFQASMVRSA
jgi:hypothetical protein